VRYNAAHSSSADSRRSIGLVSKISIVSELGRFLREEKKYWLIPMAVFFALLGLMLVMSQASAIGPFIYTLF